MKSVSSLSIPVLPATFGVTQGVRHGIGAIDAKLYEPQAVVGVLLVQRKGEAQPDVALAHIDDPAVTAASVVKMQTTLCGSAWQKFRKPATACTAMVLCGPEADPHPFLNATKQNFWGCPVGTHVMCLPSFSGKSPLRIAYDIAQGSFFSPLETWKRWEVTFAASVQRAVQRHQCAPRGRLKRSAQARLWLANVVFGGFDMQCPNPTGDDYQRGPVLPLFDLRRPKLTGVYKGLASNAPK